MIELIVVGIFAIYFVISLLFLNKADSENKILKFDYDINWFFMLGKIILKTADQNLSPRVRFLVYNLKISALLFFLVSLFLIIFSLV